jgi:predicted carbohydrate-binding protein with CBM5 and CBM33 domain
MSRRLLLAFLSAMFVYGLSVGFAPSARAANCDVNACINACSKKCATSGCGCASWCLQTIEERKKAKQCK